jgi:peptide deformylase
MSILKVARMGHPVLRTATAPLERGDIRSPAVQRLIDDMMDTMAEYHGVGLAAPQVHESVRLFVVAFDPTHLRNADEVVVRLRWFLERGALHDPEGSPILPR